FVKDMKSDTESPVPLEKVKAFGTDSGVRYSLDATQDGVRGGPLHSGTTYFYTVTSYSVGVGQFQQVLESPFVPVAVVPQTPAAGVNPSAAGIGDLTHDQDATAPPNTPLSTDLVTATSLDPTTMVNADWQVGFKPNGSGSLWYLVRRQGTAVDTVINKWNNTAPDENYPVVDGIQVKIVSYPLGQLGNVAYVDTTGGNPTA